MVEREEPFESEQAGDKPSRNSHDSFFKQAFGNPAIAADELRCLLPPDAAGCIVWDSLTAASANFVNSKSRQRIGDLVFHAALKDGGEALLWFLLEHQSTEKPWMPLHVIGTELAMWEHWTVVHPHSETLPMVVPVVVYHGAKPWRGATSMDELYGPGQPVRSALGDYVLRSRFLLDDLNAVTDDEIRTRRMDVYGRLALLAMARAREADFLRRLGSSWREEIRLLTSVSGE